MSVFALASSVAGFVKVRYLEDKAVVDDRIFRLHYRITSAILFLSCLLVTANELIGSPIQCIVDGAKSDDEAKAVTTFCWITNTFTLPELYHKKQGVEVISSGVGQGSHGSAAKHHSYYQWVPFVLFFQGVLFYLPHWMWKNWEEGRMKKLTDGLRGAQIGTKESRNEQQSKVVQYFVESLHMHNVYAMGYFFCQVLNFVNVIANVFLINKFLGGTFLSYGLDVLNFSGTDQPDRDDPMILIFPRLTKCTFHKYGPSGTPMQTDALCVLALNVINEKIYIFLWFWLLLLAVFSAMSIAHSVAICLSPIMREKILKSRFSSSTSSGMRALVRNTRVGDFLLLHLMGKNLNTRVYCDLLDEISCRLHLNDDGIVTTPSTIKLQPLYPSDKLRLQKEDEVQKSV